MIKTVTLENGIRLIFEPIKEAKKVGICCSFAAGSQYDPPCLNGLAHVVEHTLFLGTQTKTEEDIRNIEYKLGSSINAYTSRSTLALSILSLPEDFIAAYAILADLICHPTFPETLLEREKKVIITELDTEEIDDEDVLYRAAYKKKSLGLPIDGNAETVQKIQQQDIIDFYQARFRPENLVISIVGKVDQQKCIRRTIQLFQNLGKNNDVKNLENTSPEINTSKTIYQGGDKRIETDSDISLIHLAFEGPDPQDIRAYCANLIFAHVLEEALYKKLRYEQGLIYSIDATIDPEITHSLFYIKTDCALRNAPHIIQKICQMIKQPDQLFQTDAVRYAKKSLKLSFDESISDFAECAQTNCDMMHNCNKIISADQFFRLIDSITTDELKQSARQMISSRPTFSYCGKLKQIPTYQQIRKWLEKNPEKTPVSMSFPQIKQAVNERAG